MIVFSPLPPEFFQSQIGYGALSFTKQIFVFNLMSFDVRFPKVDALIPDPSRISNEVFLKDDSEEFEKEYFGYLDRAEPAFITIMNFMAKEYQDGSNLIIFETIANSPFCDSVVSSLIKYLYTRYGIKPCIIQDPEDIENLKIENSVFSPQGLMLMDYDFIIVQQLYPGMFKDVT